METVEEQVVPQENVSNRVWVNFLKDRCRCLQCPDDDADSQETHSKPASPELLPPSVETAADSARTERPASHRYLTTGFTLICFTFVLQLALHLMTFLLNGLAYRRLDTASLGLVNVRLGLFYSTLMFVSREAFRRACLSRGGELLNQPNLHSDKSAQKPVRSSASQWISLLNLMWFVLPVGVVVASLLLPVWLWVLPSPGDLMTRYQEGLQLPTGVLEQRYRHCLLVYSLSGLLELATEPFWLVCQLTHRVRIRILVEALANSARALGIVLAICLAPADMAVYSLALPQLLHGTTLFAAYLVYFLLRMWKELVIVDVCESTAQLRFRDLFPSFRKVSVDRPALELVVSFFGQGLLKQFLTEGERYLISAFNVISFTDQGIYDLVTNLGSTAARLLFLPMEESCHFVFGQCLVRDTTPSRQDPVSISDVLKMFQTVLRSCSLVAWIGFTFAQANSRLLLFAYAGDRLASNQLAVGLLQLYSAYVLLLAWNGSTEAFLNAAMSAAAVRRHNMRLILFSMAFLLANCLFVPQLGVSGLVLANCVNMAVRIAYSCFFINRYLAEAGKAERSQEAVDGVILPSSFSLTLVMLPSKLQTFVLIAASLVMYQSQQQFCCPSATSSALHAGVTTGMLVCTAVVVYLQEKDLMGFFSTNLLRTRKKAE